MILSETIDCHNKSKVPDFGKPLELANPMPKNLCEKKVKWKSSEFFKLKLRYVSRNSLGHAQWLSANIINQLMLPLVMN